MYETANGIYFSSFISSDDLSTETVLPLQDRNGNAITLKAGQRPVIKSVLFSNGASAASYTIFQDSNGSGDYDAGEELYAINLAVAENHSATQLFVQGHQAAAVTDKLYIVTGASSSGSFVLITGMILDT